MGDVEQTKRRVATEAIQEVEDGMVIGLGSGSTSAYAIRALGSRVNDGLDIVGVPTSHQAAQEARRAEVPVRCLEDVSSIDVAIDGADQVAGFDLIKGGGGAHTREKLVDSTADRFLVLVDDSKLTPTLDKAIPLEVLPDAVSVVEAHVHRHGGSPDLRMSNETLGPAITDNGNFVVDCAFGTLSDPFETRDVLSRIPGVVEHGLFLDMADAIYVGSAEGVSVNERT